MHDKKKNFCVTFAGATGSSKTPIANYLSYTFNIPIFNNDAIRTEVLEDLYTVNKDEYLARRDQRAKEVLEKGTSFIFDASVDRQWGEFAQLLTEHNYDWFIISMDLSKAFLTKLYKVKGYTESMKRLDNFIRDHNNFLLEFKNEVSLHITDKTFPDRLKLSASAFKAWYQG